MIRTHETASVCLWRCQRCGLQWPTLDTELIADPATDGRLRPPDPKS